MLEGGSHGRPRPSAAAGSKSAHLEKKRFELEWVLPLEPGLSTHATLFDLVLSAARVAAGEGGDEADALLDLWTTLTGQNESAEAIAMGRGVL